MCHHDLRGLVFVGAVGIKPQVDRIAEVFLVLAQTQLQERFYDPARVPDYQWFIREMARKEQVIKHANREMTSRLRWRLVHTQLQPAPLLGQGRRANAASTGPGERHRAPQL